MTIRLRITLFVILTFFSITLIGGYAVYQSRNGAVEVRLVTEGVMPTVLASSDLMTHLKQLQLSALTMVSEPDIAIAQQANDKLKQAESVLQQALAFQLQHVDSNVQRGLVTQASESLVNYIAAIDDMVKFKLAGKNDIAQATFFGNALQYQEELSQIIETLRIEKNRSKDIAITVLNNNLSTTTTTILIVTVVAGALLTILGYLLYRQIVVPISRMQTMMSEISNSQDFSRSVPVDRMDEIGHSIIAFNGMIETIQRASSQLRQKTADMQTMLQNIPQGILTITEGNLVHSEYSAFLETVFETPAIAGRDVMELVFSDSNLGADTLSQTAAVGGACIGEDVMNFTFNEHLMVGEIEKTMADGRVKILDLSWSPITDGADTIVRLMLCVRDVTELRQLAAEANEQKRELEIIGEILAVTGDKFHAFVVDASTMLKENEKVIRQNPSMTAFAIAKLFRNMHTVKGNARTYGLLHLANIVHGVEEHYDDLRHPDRGVAWDQAALLTQLLAVEAELERYRRINDVTLARQAGQQADSGLHYLTIDRQHVLDSLHRLETVNTANLHELVAARNAVRKTLRLLGTERIADTLASVTESLPGLAQELGKPMPQVELHDNGYVVHSQAAPVLKNVFMHLMRNALDHGLEAPHTRLAKGKPAAGTIRLEMGVLDGMLQFALSDDGAGLALERIRRVAIERGLFSADDVISDTAAAQLILRAGFSTRQQVSEVSGRGVGLDAVCDFVAAASGRVSIAFTDDAVGAEFRAFQIIVTFPDSMAVEVDGIHVPWSEPPRMHEDALAPAAQQPDVA
ncbi:MAG: ATP-binding protein [Pseudomonadota bacterium]